MKAFLKSHFNYISTYYFAFVVFSILFLTSVELNINLLVIFTGLAAFAVAAWITVVGNWQPSLHGKSAFSWDFFYSLPLSKRELFWLKQALWMISVIPMIFVISYFIADSQVDGGEGSILKSSLSFLPLVGVGFFVLGCTRFLNNLKGRRRAHQNIGFLRNLMTVLKVTGLCIGASFIVLPTIALIELAMKRYSFPSEGSFILITGLALVIYGIFQYFQIFKHITDYRKSYIDPKINFMKEIPVASIGFVPILAMFFLYQWMSLGSRDPLSRAIASKDYIEIERIIGSKEVNINKSNKKGFNPYMVAVHRGDLKALKMIEAAGAKPTPKILRVFSANIKKGMNDFLLAVDSGNIEMVKYILSKDESKILSKTFLGANALQLAATKCKSLDILDFILSKNKLNINQLNSAGESAVHLAARYRCINNLISLRDHGADFNIKNKEEKLAIDYVSGKSRNQKQIRLFVNKAMRKPASISK